MPFVGTPVVKEVSDGLVRITGVSVGSSLGTIGLHECDSVVPDIRLPAAFQPRPYGDVTMQDSIEIQFVQVGSAALLVPVSVLKGGTDQTDFLAVFANTTGSAGGGGGSSLLGSAAAFGVLGASTDTNTGATVITGDLGLSPGTSVTGFPPGSVTGTQHITDATAAAAQADAMAAYVVLQSMTPTQDLSGQDLGGMTLGPGVYKFDTSAQLTGTLTLDAGNDPTARFVFQIGSTLTTASAAVVALVNSALASNVYWQVGSSATIGTTTTFNGTIIALASVTLTTSANITRGAVIALTGAVTMDTNHISVSATGGGGGIVDSSELEIYIRHH